MMPYSFMSIQQCSGPAVPYRNVPDAYPPAGVLRKRLGSHQTLQVTGKRGIDLGGGVPAAEDLNAVRSNLGATTLGRRQIEEPCQEALRITRQILRTAVFGLQELFLLGSNPVAGPWSVYKGSIYKASWPTQPQQVFVDGHLMNEARWPATAIEDLPNMTYALADDGGETHITSSTLPNVDLTGAWVQIMAGQSWVVYTRQVAAHDRSAGKLTFASINAMNELVPFRGNDFYVF